MNKKRKSLELQGHNKLMEKVYNAISPIYDIFWKRPRFRERIMEMLELNSGDRVLETSVGTGANAVHVAKRVGRGGCYVGIDISEGMLRVAEKKKAQAVCSVEYRLMNAEELDFEDNSFDAVVHIGGINMFSRPEAAIEEMIRVLKPGRKMVIADETVDISGKTGRAISKKIRQLFPRIEPPTQFLENKCDEVKYEKAFRGIFYIIQCRKKSTNGAD